MKELYRDGRPGAKRKAILAFQQSLMPDLALTLLGLRGLEKDLLSVEVDGSAQTTFSGKGLRDAEGNAYPEMELKVLSAYFDTVGDRWYVGEDFEINVSAYVRDLEKTAVTALHRAEYLPKPTVYPPGVQKILDDRKAELRAEEQRELEAQRAREAAAATQPSAEPAAPEASVGTDASGEPIEVFLDKDSPGLRKRFEDSKQDLFAGRQREIASIHLSSKQLFESEVPSRGICSFAFQTGAVDGAGNRYEGGFEILSSHWDDAGDRWFVGAQFKVNVSGYIRSILEVVDEFYPESESAGNPLDQLFGNMFRSGRL